MVGSVLVRTIVPVTEKVIESEPEKIGLLDGGAQCAHVVAGYRLTHGIAEDALVAFAEAVDDKTKCMCAGAAG
jgi:hypothetical protein